MISLCIVIVAVLCFSSSPKSASMLLLDIPVNLDTVAQSFLQYAQRSSWCSTVSGSLHLGHLSHSTIPNFFNLVPE